MTKLVIKGVGPKAHEEIVDTLLSSPEGQKALVKYTLSYADGQFRNVDLIDKSNEPYGVCVSRLSELLSTVGYVLDDIELGHGIYLRAHSRIIALLAKMELRQTHLGKIDEGILALLNENSLK